MAEVEIELRKTEKGLDTKLRKSYRGARKDEPMLERNATQQTR